MGSRFRGNDVSCVAHVSSSNLTRKAPACFPPANKKRLPSGAFFCLTGGKGEIRTHGTPKRTPDFESGAFDHSATFPDSVDPSREGRIISGAVKLASSPDSGSNHIASLRSGISDINNDINRAPELIGRLANFDPTISYFP
jgi:hypothetical protein